jgi:excisionase family DNA binding protein
MSAQESTLLYTVTAAARRLGVSRTTLHKLLDSGDIGYRRVGSDRRIPDAELVAFAERGVVRAEQPS